MFNLKRVLGGFILEYKRFESFRHVLTQAVDVQYSFVVDEIAMTKTGEIVDISPSGICMVTTESLSEQQLKSVITFTFCLHQQEIKAIGFIRWKKFHKEGFQYGVDLNTTEELENLIISELKLRRKQEVLKTRV